MSEALPTGRITVLSTRDGLVNVTVFEPSRVPPKGGVIFYMDAFGIRPELSDMCRRYAEAGYIVFLPDLFHRLGPSVQFAIPETSDAPLDPAMGAANAATTLGHSVCDTDAVLTFARDVLGYDRLRFMTVGYCMGARHALAAAAAFPDRIAATACIHGGRLVTGGAASPHLLISQVTGAIYFAFAADDETCPDEHKALIEKTIRMSGVAGATEHFNAHHGWTFPTRWCHDRAAADRVQSKVIALFDAASSL